MELILMRLQSGEQVISELSIARSDSLEIVNPVALVPTQDGNINFVPWSPLAERDSTVFVLKANVVYWTTPNK